MKKSITQILSFLVGIFILGAVSFVAIIIYFSSSLPKISSLSDYRPAIPSTILAKDGTILAEIALEKREIATFDEIPELIVNAFLSAEDAGFYQHSGVDYMGVLRALIANIQAGRVVQGGSTITQQVAKSLLLTRERSISRKIKDFLLARKIEEKLSKEEILYLYLNQVYLGGGYYGVKAAFHGYFGKDLNEASIAEAAMVAGLLVAPGKYSPYVKPRSAKKRQSYVLGRLYKNEKITKEEYETALDEEIKYRLRRGGKFKAGHFTDWVRQRVIEVVGEDNLKIGGYKIQTSLDWELQQVAEKEVSRGVARIDKRQGYKGVLGNIKESDKDEFIEKFRSTIYKKSSHYFTISKDYKQDYELTFDSIELEKILNKEKDFRERIASSHFHEGYLTDDPFLEQLREGKSYEAIVEHVDDLARIIYVSLGGVKGVIPYSGFRWAHERNIDENRNYYSFITRPSKIVKTGDKIYVELIKKKTGFYRLAEKGIQKYFEKLSQKDKKYVKSQKFLKLELSQKADVEAALVSIDPKSGEIISFVGGADFNKSQFNRAIQSRRQPGSSFKPLLFAAGLENGYTPSTIIVDSPETLGGVDEGLNWKPRNYDGKFKGPMTFRTSLEHSRNIPTIKIADDLGVPLILDFMERIGFNAKLSPDLSLALGSFGVTLMDLVSTYSIFPNGGKKISAKSILSIHDRDGNIIPFDEIVATVEQDFDQSMDNELQSNLEDKEKKEGEKEENLKQKNPFLTALGGDQVYDPRLAYIMSNLLKGVVLHGTGRSAREVSNFLGGKTGTTSNYVDAWFLGFSSNIVTGVWTGFDENETLGWGETGTKSALPIWKEFMRAGIKKYGEYDFRPPLGIVNVFIDKKTGKAHTGGERAPFLESFVEGTEPGAQNQKENLFKKDEQNSSSTEILEEDEYYSTE